MLALSTSWNAHRHSDGEMLLREIQELGFGAVSLASGTKPSLIAGLKRAASRGRMAAVALEGFFPAPEARREGFRLRYHLTASNASDRRKALEWTKQAMDYAAEFGARLVLLDLGSAAQVGFTASLARLAASRQLHSRTYVKLKLAGIAQRSARTAKLLDRARASLDALLPIASAKGVRLALVAQALFEAVPSEAEAAALLQEYRETGRLVYWHDFAATQVKANLGFVSHAGWLQSMRLHLVGGFIQDVAWPDQGQRLPFSGGIDYGALIPSLPPGIPLAWRVPPATPAQELHQARLAWNEELPLISCLHPARLRP